MFAKHCQNSSRKQVGDDVNPHQHILAASAPVSFPGNSEDETLTEICSLRQFFGCLFLDNWAGTLAGGRFYYHAVVQRCRAAREMNEEGTGGQDVEAIKSDIKHTTAPITPRSINTAASLWACSKQTTWTNSRAEERPLQLLE